LKNYNDISKRQCRRRIAHELLNIDHDLDISNYNIETVSTPSISPVSYNISNSNKPKNTESLDVFSVSNGIDNDINVHNTSSYNYTPNSFYEFSSNNFSFISSASNVSIEPEMRNLNDSDSLSSIHEKLSAWAINEKIPLKSVSSLLKILYFHNSNDFKSLPLDARSLLQTPRSTEIRIVHPGLYWHNGLEKCLLKYLTVINQQENDSNQLDLIINIDGLPISKSSNSQFWPILGSIFKTNYVFLIGLYHGYNKKPSDIHQYLDDFISETNQLIGSGLTYKGQQYNVCVKIFCADAPAKAYIMNVKHHSGYSSCSKCDVEEEYIRNRVCFPDFIGNKRTDIDFLEHKDTDYHQGTSPLEKLQGFGLVSNVPYDYLQLVNLGVFKKMINLWHTGELNVRLSSQSIKQISDTLENIRHNVPLEFQRKPRSMLYFRQWKGTEFRLLLNYTGPVVFKNVLRSDVYNNFLTLNIVMTILSSKMYCENAQFINYARKLLSHFVTSFNSLYGSHNISYNVHGLLHLVDDVEQFGPLDNFSAYRFENYLGKLKKKICKDDKPLQQIARRYTEIENNLKIDCLKIINNNEIKYKKSTVMDLYLMVFFLYSI